MIVKVQVKHEVSWLSAAWFVFKAPALSFYLLSVAPSMDQGCAVQSLMEEVLGEVEKLLSS